MHTTNSALNWLPPGFATQSIIAAGHPLLRAAEFAALLFWTALFFAGLAYRLEKQFLGEYLSEGAPRVVAAARAPRHLEARKAETIKRTTDSDRTFLSPSVAACLRKEFVYLRGNSNQIIAMITPLIFVFILSRGMLARHPSYLLSGAIGYAIIGLLAALYNIFGADGSGVQLYLLAPVRLRDVVLAKNIAGLTLLLVEVVLAWCLVQWIATEPISLAAEIATAFWVIFLLFTNLTLGTLRSIQSPRKVALAQTRSLRTPPASRTSGLLILAIIAMSMLLQVPVTLLCRHYHNPWLAVVVFAPLAAVAVGAYALLLSNADHLILTHRDSFAQELVSS
jgi:ABC-2 type transport system permease protein